MSPSPLLRLSPILALKPGRSQALFDFGGSGGEFGSGQSPFTTPGGGSGPIDPGGGIIPIYTQPGYNIGNDFPGGTGGGSVTVGTARSAGLRGMAYSGLSAALGIPNINWGRLAAFLLGMLLIAAGILGLVFGGKTVKTVVKHGSELLEVTGG